MREIVAPTIAFVLVVAALILVFADGGFDDRPSCSKTTTRVTATSDRLPFAQSCVWPPTAGLTTCKRTP